MSYSKLTESLYTTPKAKENQLLNQLFANHDIICGCNSPQSHLTFLLIKNCHPTDFNKEERQLINKWHGTIGTTTDIEDAGIKEGELEALFAEPEEDTTG